MAEQRRSSGGAALTPPGPGAAPPAASSRPPLRPARLWGLPQPPSAPPPGSSRPAPAHNRAAWVGASARGRWIKGAAQNIGQTRRAVEAPEQSPNTPAAPQLPRMQPAAGGSQPSPPGGPRRRPRPPATRLPPPPAAARGGRSPWRAAGALYSCSRGGQHSKQQAETRLGTHSALPTWTAQGLQRKLDIAAAWCPEARLPGSPVGARGSRSSRGVAARGCLPDGEAAGRCHLLTARLPRSCCGQFHSGESHPGHICWAGREGGREGRSAAWAQGADQNGSTGAMPAQLCRRGMQSTQPPAAPQPRLLQESAAPGQPQPRQRTAPRAAAVSRPNTYCSYTYCSCYSLTRVMMHRQPDVA